MYHVFVFICMAVVCADEYIVVLKPLTDTGAISSSHEAKSYLNNHITNVTNTINSIKILRRYESLATMGFVAYSMAMDEDISMLGVYDEVKFVEEVDLVKVANVDKFVSFVPFVPSAERLSTEPTMTKEGSCTITYETIDGVLSSNKTSKTSVNVYVLDTGIQSTHVTFDGRVTHGFDAFNDEYIRNDPHGHGTQVAGIIGGSMRGVNPNTRLINVRVLGPDGTGRVDDVIAGLDYVLDMHREIADLRGRLHAVVNMSFSGKHSRALQFAIYVLSQVVLPVVSAGDEDMFSCGRSPANSDFALTVGATSRYSNLPLLGSNFGDCLDVHVPGEDISAPFIGPSNKEFGVVSGSSASTALVTGIVSEIIGMILSTPAMKAGFERYIPDAEISRFFKDMLTSTRARSVTEHSHLTPYQQCDLYHTVSASQMLEVDLRLNSSMAVKKTIPGIERAKQNLKELRYRQSLQNFY